MRIKGERRAFAQMEQTGDGVDIGVGQHHGGNRRGPQAFEWMQASVPLDLLAQVRRCIDQHPAPAVGRER